LTVLGIELRALDFAEEVLYHLSHIPNTFFALIIFKGGSHILAKDPLQTTILLPLFFHIAGTTGKYHHAWLID
jgi:hypothetical protein